MCTRPITGWRSRSGPSANGKWPITFSVKEGYNDMRVKMPCGRCLECKQKKRMEWAVRCINEASLYEDNRFITLTYNEENCPDEVRKRDVQLFLKRLRKEMVTDESKKLRYFGCGEYGKNFGRPHYHLALFNCMFGDEYLYTIRNGFNVKRSPTLEKLWTKGFSEIGDLTWQSASYIAKYVTKKITGQEAEGHYKGRCPEFAVMSTKPGLGLDWFKKYCTDVHHTDKIIVSNNLQIPVPRYYNSKWEKESVDTYQKALKERHRRREVRSDEENAYRDRVKIIYNKQLKKGSLECQ